MGSLLSALLGSCSGAKAWVIIVNVFFLVIVSIVIAVLTQAAVNISFILSCTGQLFPKVCSLSTH